LENASQLVLFAMYNQKTQVKDDEMGRACSKNEGGAEPNIALGNADVRARIIFRWLVVNRDRAVWYGLH
jgi:hypothetical protein